MSDVGSSAELQLWEFLSIFKFLSVVAVVYISWLPVYSSYPSLLFSFTIPCLTTAPLRSGVGGASAVGDFCLSLPPHSGVRSNMLTLEQSQQSQDAKFPHTFAVSFITFVTFFFLAQSWARSDCCISLLM